LINGDTKISDFPKWQTHSTSPEYSGWLNLNPAEIRVCKWVLRFRCPGITIKAQLGGEATFYLPAQSALLSAFMVKNVLKKHGFGLGHDLSIIGV
jgi:hypothetical protein